MSRIEHTFAKLEKEGKKGLIPFITAGDPSLEITSELIFEFGRLGAAVVEVGVPFSDPMADGPVIQRSSERALRRGVSLKAVLDTAMQARKRTDVPIVLFSYLNPLLQYGVQQLSEDAAEIGIDGVLVTDLTPEEASEVSSALRAKDIDLILLVAPTSTDIRLRLITEKASGFIYAVSRAGVTGPRNSLSLEAEKLVNRVRKFSDLPIVVGFGISTADQVAETWRYADGAVVGSAIVAEIEKIEDKESVVNQTGRFFANLFPQNA